MRTGKKDSLNRVVRSLVNGNSAEGLETVFEAYEQS